MACAHPFLLKTDKFSPVTNSYNHYIPCGYCLNCRVDKQNSLAHRCEQELINFGSGAFVTFTYDDYHILRLMRKDKNGNPVATLCRDDIRKFNYRLRKNIQRNLPDCILSNHHYKQISVGEYGSDGQIFDRPHFHCLFFGLDFAYCKKMFERSWQGQGMIKVLPILNGGIRYVLKYLDKQLFGKQAEQKYDDNNLERPFQTHSIGLGSSLFKNQIEYMNNHNGCYRWKGKDFPIPQYYKNKYFIKSNKYLNYENSKIKYKLYNGHLPKNRYDLHDFNIKQNLLREKELNISNFQHGRPIYDYDFVNHVVKPDKVMIDKLINESVFSQIPF